MLKRVEPGKNIVEGLRTNGVIEAAHTTRALAAVIAAMVFFAVNWQAAAAKQISTSAYHRPRHRRLLHRWSLRRRIGCLSEWGPYRYRPSDSPSMPTSRSTSASRRPGQKLQYSATEDVALQRPNGLYVEWSSDLGNRRFWYDGKAVTIFDPETAFYGSDAAAPADRRHAGKTDQPAKLSRRRWSTFLHTRSIHQRLAKPIQSGFSTGDTQVNGLGDLPGPWLFVEKHIDCADPGSMTGTAACAVQARVITYKNDSSLPQFSAVFSNWDFAPRIAASHLHARSAVGRAAIPLATVTANSGSK